MHILLKGIAPVEIGLVLCELVIVHKFVKISDLNMRLNNFFVKNYVDKRNKPPAINSFDSNGVGLSQSMKAGQMWSLLKYLPLIIDDKIQHDNNYWLFLLHLSKLVDLISAPSFTHGMIAYLSQLISEHLHLFKQLFVNNASLKSKHHLLVHLSTIITKSGPLIGMCCLCYELKSSFFKLSANILCNFTNVCKTLAYRYQCYSLYATLSGIHIRNYVEPGKVNKVCLMSAPYCHVVCAKLGCEGPDFVLTTSKLSRATLEYKTKNCFVTGENEINFGRAIYFASLLHDDKWYIVKKPAKTIDFNTHFHSCLVQFQKQ